MRPNTVRTNGPEGTRLWNLPQSSRQGDIVFPGEILETGIPAIFRYSAGQIEVIAESGQPFEDGTPATWEDALELPSDATPFMTPYLNAPGQILLWADVDTGDEGTSGLSPWIIDRLGATSPVLLAGDTFEFAGADLRAVTPASHHDAATAKWYGGTVLSSAGHVLTRVQAGDRWGILYTEPGSGISAAPDVGIGLGGLSVRLLPHPFQGLGAIELRSSDSRPASVSIYDISGRLVAPPGGGFHGRGSHGCSLGRAEPEWDAGCFGRVFSQGGAGNRIGHAETGLREVIAC